MSTPPPSAMASSRGGTTSRSPAFAFPISPPGTRPALSVSYTPLATTSFPAHSTRSVAPTTIGDSRPGSAKSAVHGATARPRPGEPLSSGATSPSCWLWTAPRPRTPSPPTLLDVSGRFHRRTGMPFSTRVCVMRTSVASSVTSYSLSSCNGWPRGGAGLGNAGQARAG